jgi:AraC-like DNA-binding protein
VARELRRAAAPHRWPTSQRILHARQLLEATSASIEEVAAASGFNSAAALRCTSAALSGPRRSGISGASAEVSGTPAAAPAQQSSHPGHRPHATKRHIASSPRLPAAVAGSPKPK